MRVRSWGLTPTVSGDDTAARSGNARDAVEPARRRILAGLMAVLSCVRLPCPSHAAESKRFTIKITKGRVSKSSRTLRVTEGDRVEITFTGDQKLTLHLHGIDVEITVIPGKPVLLRFDATVAGRFPIEAHGGNAHRALLYVEVHPR